MEKHWAYELENAQLSEHDMTYSQFKEDLISDYIFKQIGTTNKFLVDVGSGGAGLGLSNTHFFKIRGWDGLYFDIDGSAGSIKEFIKPDNIIDILIKYDCKKEFDLLSVDIDSFDYDVIDNILKHYNPRLVIAEFNGTLEPTSKVKIAYEDGYVWDGTNKYGFSLGAGIDLFEKHGYKVVLNNCDTNIFAIKSDLLPVDFKKEIKGVKNMYHKYNSEAKWINL